MHEEATTAATPLVLASGSRYRRMLLERFGLPFAVEISEVPEYPRPGEEPGELVIRLATAKARAVAARHAGAIVIGADQVAVRDGEILGKPANLAAAARQLEDSSGRAIEFLTGVCVIDGRQPDADPYLHVDITRVAFHPLSRGQIKRYLAKEEPLDCAGSFKAEGLGISLFERIDSQDPTGLIGLPLIWLSGVLRHLGFRVP
jgi:septum formation protein